MKFQRAVLTFPAIFLLSMNLGTVKSLTTSSLPAVCPSAVENKPSQGPIEVQAFRLMMTGQFDQAVELLTSHLTHEPENYRLALLLAIAYEQTDQIEPAIKTLLAILDHGAFRPLAPLFPQKEKDFPSTFISSDMDKIFSAEVCQMRAILSAGMRYLTYGELFNYPSFALPASSDSWEQSVLLSFFPSKPAALRSEVLAHLGMIARDQNDEHFKQIVQALELRHIPHAALKLRLTFDSFSDPAFWPDVLRQYPDDMDIQVLWIDSPAFPGITSQEQLHQLYDELKQKNQSLALLAAFGSLQGTAVDQIILQDALVLLVQNKKIPRSVIYKAALKMIQARDQKVSISSEIYLSLARELQQRISTLPTQPTENYFLESQVLPRLLAYGGDYASLVQYLDQLFSQTFSAGISSQPTSRNYDDDILLSENSFYLEQHAATWNSEKPMIQDLNYWERLLPGFNSSVFDIIDSLKRDQTHLKLLNIEELDRQADKAQQPILRIMLADLCGKKEKIQPLIRDIVDNPKATIGELLFVIARRLNQSNDAEVFSLLERVQSLADSPMRKRVIDGLVLGYALNHVLVIQANKTYVDKVRAIMIDFDKQDADTQDIHRLISLFRTFGTNDDLPRILDLNKRLAKRQEVMQKQFQSSRWNDSSEILQKNDARFRENKKEQAIGELVKAYRSEMEQIYRKQWGDPMEDMGRYFFQEMARQLFAFSSVDRFIECLKATLPNDPLRAGLEMGYACELLDKNDQAVTSYRKLLKIRPNHTFANLHLALILITDKKTEKEALDCIARAARENPYYAGRVLSNLVGRQEYLSQIFPKAKLAIALLEHMDSTPPAGFDRYGSNEWFSQILIRMEQPRVENCISIPALLSVSLDKSFRDADAAVRPLIEKRYSLYLALCNAAEKVPMFSSVAVARKYGLLKLNREPLGALETEARAAILARVRYDVRRTFRDQSHQWADSIYDSEKLNVEISPEVFYIGKLYRENRTAEITSFLCEVERTGSLIARIRLENIYRLYQASSDGFLKTAQTTLDETPSVRSAYFGYTLPDFQDTPSFILQVWREGQKEVDLTPLALTLAKRMMKNDPPIPADYSGFLIVWGNELFQWKGGRTFARYLDQLQALEPPASAEASEQSSFAPNLFASLFNRWARSDVLLLTLIDYLQLHPELYTQDRFDGIYPLSNQLNGLARRWDILCQSGLFASTENYRSYYLDMSQEPTSLLQESLRYYHGMCERHQAEFMAKVRSIEPATLGTELWQLLAKEESGDKVYACLGRSLVAIRQLPKNRQRELFQSVNAVLATYTVASKPEDKTANLAYDFSLTLLQESLPEKIRQFMSAKVQTQFGDMDYPTQGAALVAELITTDKALADRVYDHAIQVLKQQAQPSHQFDTNTKSPKGMLCERLIERITDLPGLCYVMQKIQAAEGIFEDYDLCDPLWDQWDEILSRWVEAEKQKAKYTELTRSERLATYKKMVLELDRILSNPAIYPLDFGVISPQNYKFDFSKEDLKAIATWANGIKNRKNPWLLDKISIDAQEMALIKERRFRGSSDHTFALEQRIIQDESLSPGLRLLVYRDAHLESSPISTPCTKTALALIKRMGNDPFERAPELIERVSKYLAQMPIDEEWKKEVLPYCATWRRLAGTPSDYGPSSDDVNDPDVAMRMVQLYLEAGDKNVAKEIFDNPVFRLKTHFPCVVILLNYSVHDWIADIFTEHWKDMDFEKKYPTYYAMDSKTRDAANDVVTRLADEDIKFFARCVYSQIPKYLSKDELIEFAKTFQTATFSSSEIRKRCLEILLHRDELSFLKEEKKAEVSSMTALAVATDPSDDRDMNVEQYLIYMKELLIKGRLEEFHKQVLTLKPALKLSNQEYSVRQMLLKMCSVLGCYLTTYPENIERVNIGESDPVTPLANSPADYINVGTEIIMMNNVDQSLDNLYGPLISLYFICDREKDLDTWFAKQSGLFKQIMTETAYNHSISDAIILFLRVAQGKPVSQRAVLAQRLIRLISSPQARSFYGNISPDSLQSPILTLDPIFKYEIDALFQFIATNPEKVLAEHLTDPFYLQAITIHYQKRKQFEKALAVCKTWVAVDTNANARIKMIDLLSALNKPQEALAQCLELIKTDKNGRYQEMLKKAYIEAGEYDKAIEMVYMEGNESSQRHFRFRERAEILLKAKRYDQALVDYDKARDVSEDRTGKLDYAIKGVKICIEAGKLDEAQKRVEAIEQSDPPSYYRNQIDQLKKNLDTARQLRSHVGDLTHPNLKTVTDETVLKSLRQYYHTVQQPDFLEPVYRRWVELRPETNIYYEYLQYLRNNQKYLEALDLCQEIVTKFPQEKVFQRLLVYCYLDCGKIDEALTLAKTCYKDPDFDPNDRFPFIKIFVSVGQFEEAQWLTQKAIDEQSDPVEKFVFKYELARIYLQQKKIGLVEKMMGELKKGAKSFPRFEQEFAEIQTQLKVLKDLATTQPAQIP